MKFTEYAALSVLDIQEGLATRQFSAAQIAQAALAAQESVDPSIHAFLEPTPQLALAAAQKIDSLLAKTSSLSPEYALVGAPIAFKDNMNQLGTYTTCGSKMLANYQSTFTATCVAKAVQAGALPLGKLNMDEFAFGSSTETSAFGRTFNPWDISRVPGGSSGGSAAAVAAGIATVSLGSDTGGSIRQPASFCGVVGFKPTYGVISRYGVVAFGSSLDQVGPFARSVKDAAAVMDAISGRDPLDCTSQDVQPNFLEAAISGQENGIKGLKVGIVREYLDAPGVDAEIIAALKDATLRLEQLGAQITEVELPNAKAALSAYYVIGPCEAFSNLSRFDSVRYGYKADGAQDLGQQYEQSRADGFGPEAVRRIMLGSYLLSSGIYDTYYYPAQQVRTLITQDYQRAFEAVDVLLTPVSPRTAFKFGEISDPTSMYLSDIFTIPINIAGNGGLSLPTGLGQTSGLPVSVQIIGPQFKDQNILRVAAALEQTYDILRLAPLQSASQKPSPNGRQDSTDTLDFADDIDHRTQNDDRLEGGVQ